MEKLPELKAFEFQPDTLEAVRKELNLDERRINEAVDLLEDWLKKQAHFVKKEYSREYLERRLIMNKGLVERSKTTLEKLATFRTLMPDFFLVEDVLKEFGSLKEYLHPYFVPKMTKDHMRIGCLKLLSNNLDSQIMNTYFKFLVMTCEYLHMFDYTKGFIMLLDFRLVNPLSIAAALSPVELKKLLTIVTEGYGLRLKGIHIITDSKLIDVIVSLLKQVMSAKLGNRIYVHKDIEPFYDIVPKEMLPNDYGGKEKAISELADDWMNILASEDYMRYYREIREANTLESQRKAEQFNEQYMGMPGSFRMLSVD